MEQDIGDFGVIIGGIVWQTICKFIDTACDKSLTVTNHV